MLLWSFFITLILDKYVIQLHNLCNMITRKFESQLLTALKFFPCITLTGARQTGKTTLLRMLLPNYSYVSLDLPSVAELAEKDPDTFFEKYKTPLIIDEVQYAPLLFRHIKSFIDKNRHQMGQIILTGSQKFELMKNLSESLAGRTAILELEGLCWDEYKNAPDSTANPELFIIRGGFPELTRDPNIPLDMFFSSYLATYLERDVRQLINVINLRTFEQFIRLLAIRNAQQLNASEIANSLGVTTKTITSWISIIEASGLITLLQPWNGNSGKRIVKTPKLYFNDTGLLCWLLGVDLDNLKTTPFIGSIYETFVFSELRKQNKFNLNKKQIYYYRDVTQTEIDFLVVGGGCTMIEAKHSSNPKSDDAKNMKKLVELLSNQKTYPLELMPTKFAIACNTDIAHKIDISTSSGTITIELINTCNLALYI